MIYCYGHIWKSQAIAGGQGILMRRQNLSKDLEEARESAMWYLQEKCPLWGFEWTDIAGYGVITPSDLYLKITMATLLRNHFRGQGWKEGNQSGCYSSNAHKRWWLGAWSQRWRLYGVAGFQTSPEAKANRISHWTGHRYKRGKLRMTSKFGLRNFRDDFGIRDDLGWGKDWELIFGNVDF